MLNRKKRLISRSRLTDATNEKTNKEERRISLLGAWNLRESRAAGQLYRKGRL